MAAGGMTCELYLHWDSVIKLTKAISFQFGVYLFVILGITRLWLFSHCILPFQSNAMQPWVHIRPFLFPFNHYRPLSRHNSNAIEPNRTQSNLSSPIERNRTSDWVRLLKFFFVRVRLCSITELNRTQSMLLVSISTDIEAQRSKLLPATLQSISFILPLQSDILSELTHE